MKAKHKNVLRVSIFCTIVLVVFILLNSLFQPIWYSWGAINSAKGFYKEPKNTIETIFVGTSIGVTGVIPTELYEDYGICSYNLCTTRQPTMASYYWIEEAYRLHPETLKTVVFDVSSLRSENTLEESYFHKAFDYMRMSDVKWRAIKEYADGDTTKLIEFLIPLAAYHDRWSDLGTNDLKYYFEDLDNGQRGYYFSENMYETQAVDHIPVVSSKLDEDAEVALDRFTEEGAEYLERMIAFCKENDIELVLTKLPTVRWSSRIHKAVQHVADENGIKYVDFNFSPLYDRINYVSPFDCFDDNHMNYYGAHKVTKLLGEYLVENCDLTDVRGMEKYEHMEAQAAECDARLKQHIALKSAETITEYLDLAVSEDNTVFIEVKETASKSLTDDQRKVLSEMGLVKLSGLEHNEPYLAVIERGGKIVCEEIGEADQADSISYSGEMGNGTDYSLKSGGYYNGNTAYCKIGKDNYAGNTRGLNIAVYNHVIDEVIDYTVFDTHAYSARDTYSINKAVEVAALPDDADVDLKSITGQVRLYMYREKAFMQAEKLRKDIGEDNVAGFLDAYMKDSDNLIIVAGGLLAADSVDQADKAKLKGLGLYKYANIEHGEPYVALIDGNNVQTEISRDRDDVISIEKIGIYVRSAGEHAGGTCSIKINDYEYALEAGKLNIVVYNKANHCVIDSIVY